MTWQAFHLRNLEKQQPLLPSEPNTLVACLQVFGQGKSVSIVAVMSSDMCHHELTTLLQLAHQVRRVPTCALESAGALQPACRFAIHCLPLLTGCEHAVCGAAATCSHPL